MRSNAAEVHYLSSKQEDNLSTVLIVTPCINTFLYNVIPDIFLDIVKIGLP